jgi:hypothetical protein
LSFLSDIVYQSYNFVYHSVLFHYYIRCYKFENKINNFEQIQQRVSKPIKASNISANNSTSLMACTASCGTLKFKLEKKMNWIFLNWLKGADLRPGTLEPLRTFLYITRSLDRRFLFWTTIIRYFNSSTINHILYTIYFSCLFTATTFSITSSPRLNNPTNFQKKSILEMIVNWNKVWNI